MINNNPANNKTALTAYIRNKRHRGHYATAGLFMVDGYTHIQMLYSGTDPISNSHAVFKALGYLYKVQMSAKANFLQQQKAGQIPQDQPTRTHIINIYLTHYNLITVLNNLRKYKAENWPVTAKSSSDLYKEAKQANRHTDMSKIPSNYKPFIPIYKRLDAALAFFPAGVHFLHVDSQSPYIQRLASLLNAKIGNLPPTHAFLEQSNRKLTVNMDLNSKKQFLNTCTRLQLDPQKELNLLITKFIQANQK